VSARVTSCFDRFRRCGAPGGHTAGGALLGVLGGDVPPYVLAELQIPARPASSPWLQATRGRSRCQP